MSIRVVRLGTPRAPGEGLRIGTVRHPPRGVPKARFAKDDWYDVWLPLLSPSAELVHRAKAATSDQEWSAFRRHYRAEMGEPAPRQVLGLLAALSRTTNLSVGCYCEDESHCHRSVLRELLLEDGAEVAKDGRRRGDDG